MTGNSLCATVSVKTHRQGIPCRHDGKGMKQGNEGVLYWRRNKHWGGTTVERQLRENGAEACRSNSRHEYASFARFLYLSVCQPLTRYNQIKRIYPRAEKPVRADGRAFLTPQERLFRMPTEPLPYTGKAGFARRKTFFRLIIRKKRRYGTTKTAYLPDRLRDAISVLQLSDCQNFLLQPQLVHPC